ncbi:unnamed protein product [Alopecurus aequalis]
MFNDDEFSQALVLFGESQIPFYVDDSQPPSQSMSQPMSQNGMVNSTPASVIVVQDLVGSVAKVVNTTIAKTKSQAKATMKWLPHQSTFVLKHMASLIRTGVRTDKGFKEVHLNACAKALFEHCGAEVSSTQVYNHLRKWRMRWIQVTKLRDLSGARWDEETCTIILEEVHYCGHISDHPKDAEFLNKPILNYIQMQIIFSYGLATGKHAMGSGDPLDTPLPEDADTQESDTVVIDGPDKPADAPILGGKRKRGALGDDEIQAFSSMTEAVKEVAAAIRENKPTNLYPDLYVAVMDAVGFTEEALILPLGHLVDHKAQGVNFVGMAEQHRTLWLRTFLGKYYN